MFYKHDILIQEIKLIDIVTNRLIINITTLLKPKLIHNRRSISYFT